MLMLAISLLLNVGELPVAGVVTGHHHEVQGRGRRIWGTCHGAGTMCDTGHCCPGLTCVEETQGKICRKPEEKDPTEKPAKKK